MGVLVLWTFRGGGGGGGVGQNRESPDFRSPEVGRYVSVMFLLVSKFKTIGMLLNVVQIQKANKTH